MYYFFLDKLLLPVTPSDLNISIGSRNETISLINDGEINILKSPNLREISFTFMLPSQQYPFVLYYTPASVFLRYLQYLKENKSVFQFIVTRMVKNRYDYATNITVCLESYEIIESAENGSDINVSITLKEYKEYGTKKLTIKNGITTIEKVRA